MESNLSSSGRRSTSFRYLLICNMKFELIVLTTVLALPCLSLVLVTPSALRAHQLASSSHKSQPLSLRPIKAFVSDRGLTECLILSQAKLYTNSRCRQPSEAGVPPLVLSVLRRVVRKTLKNQRICVKLEDDFRFGACRRSLQKQLYALLHIRGKRRYGKSMRRISGKLAEHFRTLERYRENGTQNENSNLKHFIESKVVEVVKKDEGSTLRNSQPLKLSVRRPEQVSAFHSLDSYVPTSSALNTEQPTSELLKQSLLSLPPLDREFLPFRPRGDPPSASAPSKTATSASFELGGGTPSSNPIQSEAPSSITGVKPLADISAEIDMLIEKDELGLTRQAPMPQLSPRFAAPEPSLEGKKAAMAGFMDRFERVVGSPLYNLNPNAAEGEFRTKKELV